MKTIRYEIETNYTDGRKDAQFHESEPLPFDRHSIGYLGYRRIDFKNGAIELNDGKIVRSGEKFEEKKSFVVETYCFYMEEDGVPCNEETLYVLLECRNSEKGTRQDVRLPYRKGASAKLTPHPYVVTVLEVADEEVTLEVKDDDKTSTHLVQLYNHASRSDEHWFATGNPNDPADKAGPYIYMTLMRNK